MIKLFLFLIIFNNLLFAHPHFFIDSKIKLKENLISHEWGFDKLNSRLLLFDFDKNKNRKFDEDEKQEFIKTHFLSLEKNNYNIFLAFDEDVLVKPKNVDVRYLDKKVVLSFDINLDFSNPFTTCLIDEKIYMAYKLVDIKSFKKVEVQSSEYDYCIGVVE